MSTKQYKGPQTVRRYDGSESISDWVNKIAHMQTYPAVRQRNQISLTGNPVFLHFYQRIPSGRRCSCWGSDTQAHGNCKNCFGTGIVGGYNKYGTAQVIVEPTLPDLKLVGLTKGVAEDGPEVWVLDEDCTQGRMEATIHFDGNWGPVDYLNMIEWKPDGGVTRWSFRPKGDTDWIPLNTVNLNRLMDQPRIIEIRMDMERPGLEADSPVVINCHIRVKRTPNTNLIVKADRPKITKAFALDELGVLDEWTTAQHWLDHTLSKITSYDWFYNTEEHIRWKVVDATALEPDGYLLSWDCTCRKVQNFEPIANYPV